ncbi:hypothetical protein Tco_0070055, partial [Tanacetum coccineum]
AKIGSYLKRKVPPDNDNDTIGGEFTRGNATNDIPQGPHPTSMTDIPLTSIPITIALDTLPSDPADRPRIFYYDPNQREEIRRLYWDRGPCQPSAHIFPSRTIGGKR